MLTDRDVERIKPGETRWDGRLPGFGLRRQGSGAASFILHYRYDGQQRKMTLGRAAIVPLAEARQKAQDALNKLTRGDDPAAKGADTIADIADRWLAEHVATKLKPKSRLEYRRMVDARIKPAIGNVRSEALGRQHVAALHHGLRDTPTEANRTLAALSSMLVWAESVGLRPDGSNVCRHVKRFRLRARERFLSAVELGRLGETLAAHNNPEHVAAIRLLIFTGARLDEVLTLRWEQIDGAVATLTEHKSDGAIGTKLIQLPPPALAVLAELPRFVGCPYVFGRRDQAGTWHPRTKAWLEIPWAGKKQRVKGDMRVSLGIRQKAGMEDVHLHDLRHSFAAVGVAAGMGLPIIGRLLGHAQAATTQRYAHVANDPAAAAAAAIAEQIASAMSPA
jgi:integrase